uniref:Long wavelength sensitive opsin 1 n=1 Tax=Xenos vesparum TaxID=31928 RepID=A0A1P8SFK7_9NEOP|nr:long wavelength sensitive opsin 1 [Xenos vesparum]
MGFYKVEVPYALAWGQQNKYGANATIVDQVLPEMHDYISPYWYQFPPVDPIWYPILGTFIGIVGIIAFFGNAIVIYIFISTKSLRSPSNLLVLNLAVSDFLMILGMCPIMVVNSYYQTWVFGPMMCEIYGMWGSEFGCNSILSMMTIALDRYNVIVKGISAKPFTKKKALLWIFLVWLFSLFWTLLPFFGWGRYGPEGNMTACGTDYLRSELLHRSYIFFYGLFVYFMPLFVIIYSYYFILKVGIREQAKKMNVASLRSSENANTSTEHKLAKVALVTISLWFMAWTPYLVVNFMGIFDAPPIAPLNTIWCSLFAKCSAIYNPIVYAISHPRYKAALAEKLPMLSCADTPSPAANKSDLESAETTSVA